MNLQNKFSLWIFLCFGTITICNGQNSSFELWPETDIWYRLNPSWRLSSFIPLTKYNENDSRDLNVYLHVDYAWGHGLIVINRRMVDQEKEQIMNVWMVRGGFMEGWNLRNNTSNYAEDMLFVELHRRTPIKGDVLLSHRFRVDARWLGEDNVYSHRFRYRLMVEKEFKTSKNSYVPYMNIEPYWDSRYSRFSKTRAIAGLTAMLSPKYAIEGNLTYQYDDTYSTQNLYALNVIFHIFLEKNKNKVNTAEL